jgi:hypothetical protein
MIYENNRDVESSFCTCRVPEKKYNTTAFFVDSLFVLFLYLLVFFHFVSFEHCIFANVMTSALFSAKRTMILRTMLRTMLLTEGSNGFSMATLLLLQYYYYYYYACMFRCMTSPVYTTRASRLRRNARRSCPAGDKCFGTRTLHRTGSRNPCIPVQFTVKCEHDQHCNLR